MPRIGDKVSIVYWLLLGVTVLCVPLPVVCREKSDVSGTMNINISADSFEVDARDNTLLAAGNVVVQHRDVTLAGSRAIYFKTLQKVIITGNVTVKRQAMTMACDTVTSLVLEDKIEVSGNVQFMSGDIHGTAGLGVYDHKTQIIRLSGNPKVWQNRDELIGKLITVDFRHRKVVTNGGARAVFSADKFSSR